MQLNRWLRQPRTDSSGYRSQVAHLKATRLSWRHQFGYRFGFGLVLGLLMASLLMTSVNAQVSRATITEILDGNQVYIQNRQARVNSVAQQQQQVRTGQSRAELQFNTGAIARLAQNSRLTVGDCAQLRRGTVLVNGAMNGCTQSTLAGVRGTLYTLEVNDAGQETIQVFEGEVVVSSHLENPEGIPPIPDINPLEETKQSEIDMPEDFQPRLTKQLPGWPGPGSIDDLPIPPVGGDSVDDPGVETGDTEAGDAGRREAETVDLTDDSITLEAGQQLTLAGGEREATVSLLTAEDFEALLSGALLNEFSREIPGMGDLRRSFETLFPEIPFPAVPIPEIFPRALY
ncbi:MAG: FecR domain-containing protein [Cyanobacteria bacterium P01_A01_bin.123]